MAACQSSHTAPGAAGSLQSISAEPSPLTVEKSRTRQITVIGHYDDGTTAALVAGLSYASDNPAIASVDGAGLVTGLAVGSATVTATAAGKQAAVPVAVENPVKSLAVEPKAFSLPVGASRALAVTGYRADGTSGALTSGLSFGTSSYAVASVSAAGVVLARSAGAATIIARDDASGSVGTAGITVTAPVLVSIAIVPGGPIGPLYVWNGIGDMAQLALEGTYDNGTVGALAVGAARWQSSAPAVADVDGTGLVRAKGPGSATIRATVGALAPATVAVAVTAQSLVSVSATPVAKFIPVGGGYRLAVTGSYDAGPSRALAGSATYVPGDPRIVSVSGDGWVTGLAVGTTVIDVSVGGLHAVPAPSVQVNAEAGKVFVAGEFAPGVTFVGFTDPDQVNDVSIDPGTPFDGYASLRVNLPPEGKVTGGAFVSSPATDLRAYTAVTFQARASQPLRLALVGLGNNARATPNPGHEADLWFVEITTDWQKFTVPIPDPDRLAAMEGLFHFADAANHTGSFWLADIRYEVIPGIALTPRWVTTAVTLVPGLEYQVTMADLDVGFSGGERPSSGTLTGVNPSYFTFRSDSPLVSISESAIEAVGIGSSAVDATLDGTPAGNALAVTVAPFPLTPPPVPPQEAGAGVISLHSSVKFNGTVSDWSGNVDTWLTCWSLGNGGDPYPVGGGAASPRVYLMSPRDDSVTIEFLGKSGLVLPGNCGGTITGAHELDVSEMDFLHLDLWTPDDASSLQVKLVDAGADGLLDGGETWGAITLTGASTPPLSTGTWLSYDLPLAGFAGTFVEPPEGLRHLGQMTFIAPEGGVIFLDNVYFHRGAVTPPEEAP